jgi:hypothetical protein
MKINADGFDRKGRAFGSRVGDGCTWEGFGGRAESERTRMVSEFHQWIIERRHAVELKMLHSRGWMMETAPLARAGMDAAETPRDVPLCVFEFAQHALEYVERQRQFDLLNTYYEMAANGYDESGLQIHQGLGPAVAQLWSWFIEARAEAEA